MANFMIATFIDFLINVGINITSSIPFNISHDRKNYLSDNYANSIYLSDASLGEVFSTI